MPELPEVETIVRELHHSKLVGCTISHVELFWPKIIDKDDAFLFKTQLPHQKIIKISRRGKFIVIELSHNVLLVHLRMTGKLLLIDKNELPRKHEHLRIYFTDKRILLYEDQRKFGRWYLLTNSEDKLHKLGVEPLSEAFTAKVLQELLSSHNMQVKSFLLNQNCIAGLGNIYVDEALWESKIHPQALTKSIDKGATKLLHKAIQNVLKKGIDNLGTSLGKHRGNYFSVSGRRGGNQDQLQVFRQNGLPCPRCGTEIIKIKVAQRGTHLCPHCQAKMESPRG